MHSEKKGLCTPQSGSTLSLNNAFQKTMGNVNFIVCACPLNLTLIKNIIVYEIVLVYYDNNNLSSM